MCRLLAAKPYHQRRNVRGIVTIEAAIGRLLHHVGKHVLGHAGARRWCQCVCSDVVAAQLRGLHQRERCNAALGRRVVRLSNGSLQPRTGTGVDDAPAHRLAVLRLLTPVVAGVAADAEMPLQVHAHHLVPVLLAEADEHAVTADARVVHHHVQITEGIQSRLDDLRRCIVVRDVVGVGDRLAAHGSDLANGALGGLRIDVVHHHAGTFLRERQRVLAPQPAASASDDHHASVTDSRHIPFSMSSMLEHGLHSRSMIVTFACPPPSHIVCRPKRLPVRSSSCSSVVISFAPVAPSGCPSAIAPPLTFTRSCG